MPLWGGNPEETRLRLWARTRMSSFRDVTRKMARDWSRIITQRTTQGGQPGHVIYESTRLCALSFIYFLFFIWLLSVCMCMCSEYIFCCLFWSVKWFVIFLIFFLRFNFTRVIPEPESPNAQRKERKGGRGREEDYEKWNNEEEERKKGIRKKLRKYEVKKSKK